MGSEYIKHSKPMNTLECEYIEPGTRVLLTNPDPGYSIGEANPLIGTRWECQGTVDDSRVGRAEVCWDNGCNNTYKDHELSSTCEGRCKSIW